MRRVLGEGASKRVYLARDSRLERDVAVSVIKTEGLDEGGLARVQREVQAMARLSDHPHVVTILDTGEERGQPYIVAEYMAGGDLAELLRRTEQHRLPLGQVLQIADQLCQALEHAHRHRIIHRDLKPGNIWLTEDGVAKLGDFGLAVLLDRSRLSEAGMLVGTLAYMPPEQALGGVLDARSDLYSLGAVLYEMVAGRPPFLGDDAIALFAQHINSPPVAPSWHNPELPGPLETLILRLLSKAPEQRPPSAAAVRAVLSAAVPGAVSVSDRVTERAGNVLDRLDPGVFVDRQRELAELRARLEDAFSGRGRVVLLAGEPGIGKTRTADMLATYAGLRGARVLRGRCHEAPGVPAFWPWVQIIRAYVQDRDPETLLRELGVGATYIAQLVPEVCERLPLAPTPVLEPEQARFRLFDGVTAVLKNASRAQPLVIVLDDLHWADTPSLLLLQFLARELHAARLLVVGTYRDVALGRRHPLSVTLAELAREQSSWRIPMRGLGQRDVARFIEIAAGRPPPADLVAAVFKESEGNPFFVTEFVRLLAAEGHLGRTEPPTAWRVSIPQTIREVIGQRLARLSADCNGVLTIAAVIGREFDLEVLERASDLGGERLLDTLEEAVAARVLTELPASPGRYSFAHTLIRENLYEELGATRRLRLHRRIGELLESTYGAKVGAHLAELAYHFFASAQAGEAGKALDYARRAGDRAMALLAYEEGARLYELGLKAADLEEPTDERLRCDLLLALGEAWRRAGDSDKAKKTFRQGTALARKLGAAEQLARAALGFAWWQDTEVVDEHEVGLLEEALAALSEGDSVLRARVLGRLAVALYYGGSRERRASLSLQAVEMARRVGDTATLAYALNCRRLALWGPESVEERLASATEILALAEQARDAELALESRCWRVGALLELGDIPAADREIAAHAEKAAELREPLYLWFSARWKAMRALLDGRLEESERLAQEASVVGERLGPLAAHGYFGQLAYLRWAQGRLEEVVPLVREAAEQRPELPAYRCGLVSFYSELGWEPDARREFEGLAVHDFADLAKDAMWFSSVIGLAEACAFLRDARRAARLYELLSPYAERNVVIGLGTFCLGSAACYLGHLAATMGRWSQAEAHFDLALALNAKMGCRPWLAYTEHDYAAMLLDRDAPGDRRKALALRDRALETGQKLGMRRLTEKALALKVKAHGLAPGLATSIDAVANSVRQERPGETSR